MKNIIFLSIKLALLISVFTSFSGCNDKIKPGEKGDITLNFDNMIGENDLVLNTDSYTNAAGETFKVTKLKYYISNISLTNSAGEKLTLPQTYHLVDESVASSQMITLKDIPADDYTSVSFMIGVDSLRNTMDISQRTGDLDVAGAGADMYWTWNSGYIFFKIEGTSPQIATSDFFYHIGGFGGYSSSTINNIKTTTLSMNGSKATVRDNITPEVHIGADVLKVFTGAKNLSFADYSEVMFSPKSVDISANYVNMFEVHHVHNEK